MSELAWTPCSGAVHSGVFHLIYRGWILTDWGSRIYCATPLDGLRPDLLGVHVNCNGKGDTRCLVEGSLQTLMDWCDRQEQLAAQDAIPMTLIPRPQ